MKYLQDNNDNSKILYNITEYKLRVRLRTNMYNYSNNHTWGVIDKNLKDKLHNMIYYCMQK